MTSNIILDFLPAAFLVLGAICAVAATIMPISKRKGKTRFMSSIYVASGFFFGGLIQVAKEGRLWPGIFGVIGGVFLARIGFRKHHRDPKGITPASQML